MAVLFSKNEGYDSLLYTGINLNKAFAVRSTEITVDPRKAKKLVEQKQLEERIKTTGLPTDVTLYRNPIIINERDANAKPMEEAPNTFLHKNLKESMLWFLPPQPMPSRWQSKKNKMSHLYIDYFQPSPNPFRDAPVKELYGVGPFSVTPRFGITPNFCCISKDGKACYSKDCKACQNCFEQDEPLGDNIKTRPSQNMYNYL